MHKRNRRASLLAVLLTLAGMFTVVAAPTASAALAANHTCHKTWSYGYWTNHQEVSYTLQHANITAEAPWCINKYFPATINGPASSARLLIQNNGDFVMYDHAISGGNLIFHTPYAANRGAIWFKFQKDGNIVTYAGGGKVLWARNIWLSCNPDPHTTPFTLVINRGYGTTDRNWVPSYDVRGIQNDYCGGGESVQSATPSTTVQMRVSK